MSYDMFLFDPEAAPKTHAEFLQWYVDETEASDGMEIACNPATTSAALQSWFTEMSTTFPALNGPASPADIADHCEIAGDYNFRPHSIYVSFSWSHAEEAGRLGEVAARNAGVGLFDLSSEREDVYLPRSGRLVIAHNNETSTGLWGRFVSRFRRSA
jgi:hypothetical protein